MSILQEALRRKEAEESGGAPSVFPPFPPVEPDVRPLPPPSRPPRHSHRIVWPIGIGLVILAGLALAAFLFFSAANDTPGTDEAPSAEPGSFAGRILERVLSTLRGSTVPDTAAAWPDADMVFLGQTPATNSRLIVYGFWATWCAHCRDSIPHLNRLYSQYRGQGLEVVGITSERREVVEAFLKQVPADYPIALDTGNRLGPQLGVQAIPAAFLVTSDRRIVWKGHPMELHAGLIDPHLRAAVSVPPAENRLPDPAPTPVVQPAPPTPAPPAVAPTPPPPRRDIVWPELTVRGVLTTGSEATALINADALRIGDEIRGARLVAIGPYSVTLEYEGETRVLRIGQTTSGR